MAKLTTALKICLVCISTIATFQLFIHIPLLYMDTRINQLPSSPYRWHFSDILIQANNNNKPPKFVKTHNCVQIRIRKNNALGESKCVQYWQAWSQRARKQNGKSVLAHSLKQSPLQRTEQGLSSGICPGLNQYRTTYWQVTSLSKTQSNVGVLKLPYWVVVQMGHP